MQSHRLSKRTHGTQRTSLAGLASALREVGVAGKAGNALCVQSHVLTTRRYVHREHFITLSRMSSHSAAMKCVPQPHEATSQPEVLTHTADTFSATAALTQARMICISSQTGHSRVLLPSG